MENKYVVDTSVIIERAVSELIENKEIKGKILVPRAVIAELENQANLGKETGLLGLDELQHLQKLKQENKIELDFVGNRPNVYQIKFAKTGGEIDAIIREIAYNENAILITADTIQAQSAKVFGIEVKFITFEKSKKKKFILEKFFDPTTMSLHLKENSCPTAKKGKPGEWNLIKLSNNILPQKEIQNIAKEIVERARSEPIGFVEISREGSTIVQYDNYRIVIVRPPVSDGWEITAVRPIKKLDLNYYKLPEKISARIKTQARGIIVAGETGSGKSTFAQSVAEYYSSQSKIVKTVESPRDLQLSDSITQYSKSYTSSEEIHDILFLSRPDNIIFDEIRDTPDFRLYIDLRLAGSNCLGVLHSATPIDAIQRFIKRIDTGMIPSVLDTLIFIEKGNVGKVLTLRMTVKVPNGMTEADLARPVVEVIEFESNKVEYEIYSYGEETVVIPISDTIKLTPMKELAQKQLQKEMEKYVDNVKVEVISDHKANVYIPNKDIARIIGKQGKTIEAIEKKVGINIDVKELKEGFVSLIDYKIINKGDSIIFYIEKGNQVVDMFINDQFLFTSTSSKKGEIKIHKQSKIGQTIMKAIRENSNIEFKAGM